MLETVLISLAIGIIIGGLLLYLILKPRQQTLPQTSSAPRFSEKDAENILKRYGYQIIKKAPRKTIITKFEGQDHLSYTEADYLVKKNKKIFLVHVKSGEGEFDPNEPGFRHKLMVNDYSFAPDALLILDLATGSLLPVTFEFPHQRNIDSFFQGLIIVFIILLVIGIIWLMVWLKLF